MTDFMRLSKLQRPLSMIKTESLTLNTNDVSVAH